MRNTNGSIWLDSPPAPSSRRQTTSLMRMNDPDGNLIVLAQPGEV